jgi:hypothetical protein
MTGKLRLLMQNPLALFNILQIIIAGVCILIPVVLRLSDMEEFYPGYFNPAALPVVQNYKTQVSASTAIVNCHDKPSTSISVNRCDNGVPISSFTRIEKDRLGFRLSLSDYVYSARSYFFGMLYCMAALMFLFNGVIYFNMQRSLFLNPVGHWYNIFIGLFLFGVLFCPHCDYPVLHNVFTFLFFAGNLAAMAFAYNPRETPVYKVIRIAMVVLILLVLGVALLKVLSVLWAEWVSLTTIAIHLIMVMLSAEDKRKVHTHAAAPIN